MIKRITIQNFQKHSHFVLKLDPHVTTIVGPSDSGKSSILRAIKWVLLNHPRGASFLKDGEDRASVTIKVDGHQVIRGRGKDNTYHLDGDKFAAFGNSVPDEIAEVLNVSDLNFQGQHDPSGFWFSLTPGEVSRQLNQIVDLGSIDSTLSKLAAALRHARSEEVVVGDRLSALRVEKGALKSVKKINRHLAKAEVLQSQSSQAQQDRTRLQTLLDKVVGVETTIYRLAQSLASGEKAVKAGDLARGYQTARNRLVPLITKAEAFAKVVGLPTPPIEDLERRAGRFEEAKTLRQDLETALQEISTVREVQTRAEVAWCAAHEELDRSLGDTCPLCGLPQIPF